MQKSKQKKIVVQDHWAKELNKVRCWISGWQAARRTPGTLNLSEHVPGEQVLAQIIMAIDEAKEN